MDERSFFDNLAPTWDDNEILSTPEKVRYILGFIDIRKGQRVLDLGTGTGVLIPYIAELVGESGKITAVDYSHGMLDRAIAKFGALTPKPEFLQMDFETEAIDGEYDHILLYSVYPHLHTPFETIKWLRAVNLAENGTITIAFPTGPDFINNIHRQRHSESDILPPAEVLANDMRLNGLNAEMVKADDGCYIIKIYK